MGFFITFIIFIIVIIFIFSSKKFSPIPYFPSQPVDLPLIIKALNLKNNQTIIDLGAGDGIVIFRAAEEANKKKLNTQFVAVEINPVLIFVLHLRRLFHSNRKNIKIIRGDIFKINISSLVPNPYSLTVYLYISPWFLEKTIENCLSDEALAKVDKLQFISYMYPIKSLKKNEKIIQGKNKIFIYG
ncbi:MAG: rRNA adenine N-6-methyltransferase family protein [Patescibacteria group bacterium]